MNGKKKGQRVLPGNLVSGDVVFCGDKPARIPNVPLSLVPLGEVPLEYLDVIDKKLHTAPFDAVARPEPVERVRIVLF